MNPSELTGFAHLWSQTDLIGRIVILLMGAMSVLTWYLIATKAVRLAQLARRTRAFLSAFWEAPSLDAVQRHLEEQHPREPFGHLAYHAIVATRHHREHGVDRLTEAGTTAEFVTRTIRRVIDEEKAELESGLPALATVGSVAPFVGLFGTVWGVYHALQAIGVSGQGTLDKVAGPVGEALIMTAVGLVVAIPAVVAYNTFVRRNRLMMGRLDAFAHDLFTLMTTGAHVGNANVAQAAIERARHTAARGA